MPAITVIAFYGAVSRGYDRVSNMQDPVEVSVTLKSTGFHPSEVLIPAERFQLSLDNRTGIQELVLRMATADGTQLREMQLGGAGGDWSEMFELQAGNYILSEASHKDWVCRLKVKP